MCILLLEQFPPAAAVSAVVSVQSYADGTQVYSVVSKGQAQLRFQCLVLYTLGSLDGASH